MGFYSFSTAKIAQNVKLGMAQNVPRIIRVKDAFRFSLTAIIVEQNCSTIKKNRQQL